MNKKFSTLMAAALLVGSFSASAQVLVGAKYDVKHSANGPVRSETAYRTQLTAADGFDVETADLSKFNYNDYRVNKIEAGKWYQLEVNQPKHTPATDKFVLVQVRNYETGELSLKIVKQSRLKAISTTTTEERTKGTPSLNSSLWRIDVTATTDGSDIYKFTNKETGFTLSYNCAEATVIKEKSELDPDSKYTGTIKSGSNINKSDISEWRWYTKAKTTDPEGFKTMKLYVYNHEKKQIIGLAQKGDDVISVIADADLAGGTEETQIARDYNILSLTVRNAGVRVLSAADINSMIDADGSWMNAAHYAKRDSAYFKNGLKDKDGNEIKINNDLFNAGYMAREVSNTSYALGANNDYAGYNIYLAKQYKDVKGTLYNKYLAVMPNERYEDSPSTGNYRGLVVKDDFFGRVLEAGKTSAKIEPIGVINDKGEYVGSYGDKVGSYDKKNRDKALSPDVTVDAFTARYLWKVSYYPTVDSLVFEPLNASIVGTQDYNNGKTWEKTPLATAKNTAFYNSVNEGKSAATVTTADENGVSKEEDIPVALTLMNMGGSHDNANVLTVGTSIGKYTEAFIGKQLNSPTNKKLGRPVVTNFESVHGLKAQFDHNYTYMQRTTAANGLYFIKVAVKGDNKTSYRKDGDNLVMNMWGQLMYDRQDDYQNYEHMPATQWVIEQDTCELGSATPYVKITNREYAKEAFHGQLYKTEDGRVYFINHSDKYVKGSDAKGKFDKFEFTCGDTLYLKPITKPEITQNAYLGYKKFNAEDLNYETWAIKYSTADTYGGLNEDKYLQITEDGIMAVQSEMRPDFEVSAGAETEYGYTIPGLAQLKRQGYVMKVRDNNLIDNEWNYVVIKDDANGNPYFQSTHLKNVDGKDVLLGAFYFKADQLTADGNTAAYVPVQILGYQDMNRPAAGWNNWEDVKAAATTVATSKNVTDYVKYPKRAYYENGFAQLGIKSQTTKATYVTLDTDPETVNDAFVFVKEDRPLYMPIGKDVTSGEMNSTIQLFRTRGNSDFNLATEFFYEDGNNQSNVAESANAPISFLGVTAEGVKPVGKDVNTEFYADSVISSNPRMPQYLFFVDNDSIKDGRWCSTNKHGYFPSEEIADDEDATHHVFYNGYNAGRVLVNLNDSVFRTNTNIDLDTEAAKYAFRNYTRLGFVEGIHMNVTAAEAADKDAAFHFLNDGQAGEYLLILKGGLTLKDLASKWNVLDPVKVKQAIEDGKIDVNVLNGKHQNYAFSLRYTDDDHKDVLLESQGRGIDGNLEGSIGTFNQASWLKVLNGVPVLAQPYNYNGDHTSIGSSSSLQEVVNQSEILGLVKGATGEATANENITAGNVVVAGVNGAVVVKGAEGKNVIVSTILGKVVANEVVSSDNVTIAAPAGVVVVSVDGESFKVVVK